MAVTVMLFAFTVNAHVGKDTLVTEKAVVHVSTLELSSL